MKFSTNHSFIKKPFDDSLRQSLSWNETKFGTRARGERRDQYHSMALMRIDEWRHKTTSYRLCRLRTEIMIQRDKNPLNFTGIFGMPEMPCVYELKAKPNILQSYCAQMLRPARFSLIDLSLHTAKKIQTSVLLIIWIPNRWFKMRNAVSKTQCNKNRTEIIQYFQLNRMIKWTTHQRKRRKKIM